MRLIDADVLNFAIQADGYEHFSGCLSSSEVALLEMVKDDIDEAPTVDAVPVVRCQECKHHRDCETHFCDALGMDCPDDSEFFCYYGKRKEGADND